MIALLLGALLLAPAGASELLAASGGAAVGQAAPWFAGWTPSQRVINRTRLRAHLQEKGRRAYALVFFATWCKPCEAGLKALAERRADLDGAGLDLVLVAWRQEAEQVQPWLKARGLADATLLLDRFGRVAYAFGVETRGADKAAASLPRTVVVGADEKVRLIVGREGADYADRLLNAVADR